MSPDELSDLMDRPSSDHGQAGIPHVFLGQVARVSARAALRAVAALMDQRNEVDTVRFDELERRILRLEHQRARP